MHQFLQIISVGKHYDRRTQYSLCGFAFLMSKMEEYSTRRKRSSNEGYLGVLPKNKCKPKLEENKFMFRGQEKSTGVPKSMWKMQWENEYQEFGTRDFFEGFSGDTPGTKKTQAPRSQRYNYLKTFKVLHI